MTSLFEILTGRPFVNTAPTQQDESQILEQDRKYLDELAGYIKEMRNEGMKSKYIGILNEKIAPLIKSAKPAKSIEQKALEWLEKLKSAAETERNMALAKFQEQYPSASGTIPQQKMEVQKPTPVIENPKTETVIAPQKVVNREPAPFNEATFTDLENGLRLLLDTQVKNFDGTLKGSLAECSKLKNGDEGLKTTGQPLIVKYPETFNEGLGLVKSLKGKEQEIEKLEKEIEKVFSGLQKEISTRTQYLVTLFQNIATQHQHLYTKATTGAESYTEKALGRIWAVPITAVKLLTAQSQEKDKYQGVQSIIALRSLEASYDYTNLSKLIDTVDSILTKASDFSSKSKKHLESVSGKRNALIVGDPDYEKEKEEALNMVNAYKPFYNTGVDVFTSLNTASELIKALQDKLILKLEEDKKNIQKVVTDVIASVNICEKECKRLDQLLNNGKQITTKTLKSLTITSTEKY